VLVGAWQASGLTAVLAATGLVLGAVYMLWLYRRVVFGRAESQAVLEMAPLARREVMIFVPLALFVIWLGVFPALLLDVMNPLIAEMISQLGSLAPASANAF